MNPIWIAKISLQTQLMYDVLAVDVSQFIKLVSATKEESPSFSFFLCISRFVSPQEFHIDFDFILLWAGLLLSSGLNTSQHHTRVSEFNSKLEARRLSQKPNIHHPMSPVHLLLCHSSHVSPRAVVTRLRWLGPAQALPRPAPPASLLRLGLQTSRRQRLGPGLFPTLGPRSFLEQSRVRHRRFCDPPQHL